MATPKGAPVEDETRAGRCLGERPASPRRGHGEACKTPRRGRGEKTPRRGRKTRPASARGARIAHARVDKLAKSADLKSAARKGAAGSNPAPGIVCKTATFRHF